MAFENGERRFAGPEKPPAEPAMDKLFAKFASATAKIAASPTRRSTFCTRSARPWPSTASAFWRGRGEKEGAAIP